jgi:hypothetical protein
MEEKSPVSASSACARASPELMVAEAGPSKAGQRAEGKRRGKSGDGAEEMRESREGSGAAARTTNGEWRTGRVRGTGEEGEAEGTESDREAAAGAMAMRCGREGEEE